MVDKGDVSVTDSSGAMPSSTITPRVISSWSEITEDGDFDKDENYRGFSRRQCTAGMLYSLH